jgi:hypothetical protein
VYHDHEFALCLVRRAIEEGEDLMNDQMDGSWSRRGRFTAGRTPTDVASHPTILKRGDDAHDPASASFDGSLHDGRLNVRFRVWRRTFVIFGVITGILVAVLIGLFLTQGMALHVAGTASPASGTASPSSDTAVASSSQSAQTLAVAGLIIGCVSAIGTLFSGWGTLVTARAMARQDAALRAPRPREVT